MISHMRGRFILDIFNRDLQSIWSSGDEEYRRKLLLYSIDHYTWEMGLPHGHQSKMFSDEEYMLMIELYKSELQQMKQ